MHTRWGNERIDFRLSIFLHCHGKIGLSVGLQDGFARHADCIFVVERDLEGRLGSLVCGCFGTQGLDAGLSSGGGLQAVYLILLIACG